MDIAKDQYCLSCFYTNEISDYFSYFFNYNVNKHYILSNKHSNLPLLPYYTKNFGKDCLLCRRNRYALYQNIPA